MYPDAASEADWIGGPARFLGEEVGEVERRWTVVEVDVAVADVLLDPVVRRPNVLVAQGDGVGGKKDVSPTWGPPASPTRKNTNYFNSTTSFSGSRTRSSSTDFVCVHTRISFTYSWTVVRQMAVPYSPYVVRPMAVPYPYSQNTEPYVSSHERTGMYATR